MPVQTRNQTHQKKLRELASKDNAVIMVADGNDDNDLGQLCHTENEHSVNGAKTTKKVTNGPTDSQDVYAAVKALGDVDDEDDEDPHDYDDYECEESGNCTKCCEIGECTSKHAFSNQGQWDTDVGLYLSCPHCEPFGGAERPVMSNERYDCKGYPGVVDTCFLTRVPVEELVQKGLFIPFLKKICTAPSTLG